jgi:hypothetical protein
MAFSMPPFRQGASGSQKKVATEQREVTGKLGAVVDSDGLRQALR